MQVGVIDWHWWDLPVEKRLRRIADLGFEGVQLAVTPTELGFDLKNGVASWFDSRYRPATRSFKKGDLARVLRETGLKVTQLGPHYALGEHYSMKGSSTGVFRSNEARRHRLADINRMIDLAADLDTEFVEVMSGGDPKKPEQWPELVEFVRELADHAEERGVTLTFENMGGWQMLVADENSLFRLVRDVGSKAVRVTFDPKNLTQTHYQADIPRAVRALRGLIVFTHAGDAIFGEGSVSPLGVGTVPFPDYLLALRDAGFDGWSCIEALKKEEDYPVSRKYLEDLIRLLVEPKL